MALIVSCPYLKSAAAVGSKRCRLILNAIRTLRNRMRAPAKFTACEASLLCARRRSMTNGIALSFAQKGGLPMTRILACLATAAVAAVGTAVLMTPASTQPFNPSGSPGGYQYVPQQNYYQIRRREEERARERERDRDRDHYECKGSDARVTTTGNTRPTYGWALSSANSVWSRQTRVTYGEEWSDIHSAREERHRCFGAVIGKRCEVTAIPCRAASFH
jgi:hypothetical protein